MKLKKPGSKQASLLSFGKGEAERYVLKILAGVEKKKAAVDDMDFSVSTVDIPRKFNLRQSDDDFHVTSRADVEVSATLSEWLADRAQGLHGACAGVA